MIPESARILLLQVVLPLAALWLVGATGLWVGGRFVAKIPKATFRWSLITFFLAGIACFFLTWALMALAGRSTILWSSGYGEQ